MIRALFLHDGLVHISLPLFQIVADTMAANDTEKQRRLDTTLDKLRARYGRQVVYFGSVQESRDDAPMRISFIHIGSRSGAGLS